MRYEIHMATGQHKENMQCKSPTHPCVVVTPLDDDGRKHGALSVFEAKWYGRNGAAKYDIAGAGRAMWVTVEGPIEVLLKDGWRELP